MLVLSALTALPSAGLTSSGRVALTFDDLPVFGKFESAADGAEVTDRLLVGMTRHRWKVTGFVNEIQLEAADRPQPIALLQQWLDAGMDLGNHIFSHLSLNTTPVDAYIADVASGEMVTSPLLAAEGRRERWFQYPYLETGTTVAARATFEDWLRSRRYRVAPVTMENSDWQFSALYDDAVERGDARGAAAIKRSYLAFTRRIVGWYRLAGRALFGRQPAFVFLLHASRLNAASLEGLAGILRAEGLRVVSLDAAMRDPAYRTPDRYVGRDGNEWLERWSSTLHRDLPFESIPEVPSAIAAFDMRLEFKEDPRAVSPLGGDIPLTP
ncbi:polysaccharide deacetylase family protein [Sphingomonas sp. PWP1-2]|uniref:polysaccharide deacetylase family protein n=1 Tax=Sphingomonas sp. PWP1-2 TaxID=2804558 RepID=UPI003CF9D361